MVTQAADKKKLADTPEFKRRLAFLRNKLLMGYELQDEAKAALTDDALHQTYNDAVKSMGGQEEVHARHILVATEQEAKDLQAELKKGTAFDKLAREKSTDKASGAEGGDLGWFKRTDMVKEFSDAAFALKKGELSEAPVKTQFGFHLIKMEDRRQAPPPSFEELSDPIREELARETVSGLLDQLRSTAKIEKFNIDGSKVEAKPAAPPTPAAPGTPAPALPNPPK